jgi:rRNA maturation protein Nop10
MFACGASVFLPPVYGTLSGECVLCGRHTENGHPVEFSEKFTSYNLLREGNCICEYCYTLVKNQEFRRRSFVLSKEGVRFLSREECRDVLLSPPEPPFFIYITQSGQRQGWLSAIHCVSYNKERFWVSTDFVGHFLANLRELKRMDKLISDLRKVGVSKNSLRTGELSMAEYRKLFEKNLAQLWDEVRECVRTPGWEVLCYVAD